MSYKRPCNPDNFMTRNMVLGPPRFHVVNTKTYFRHYDTDKKTLCTITSIIPLKRFHKGKHTYVALF